MPRCFIGLGANIGNPLHQLRVAVQQMSSHPALRQLALSQVYRTAPVGPPGQPDYLNAVAGLSTALSAEALLDILQLLERQAGRLRGQRWGPRTLDLDLLLYGSQCIDTPRLTVPHERLQERDFVLVPLLDLVGTDFILPGGKRLGDAVAQCRGSTLRQAAEPATLIAPDPEHPHREQ